MPSLAHRKLEGKLTDILLDQVTIGDALVVFPHEICPVDGTIVEGHGVMDESYLTGEPFMMSRTPGSMVLSGAINRPAIGSAAGPVPAPAAPPSPRRTGSNAERRLRQVFI
jgi:cation transport ATPase